MKMSYENTRAEERMRGGVLTADGFFGDDVRPLADIIEADEEVFQAFGLDFDQVADKLEKLARRGESGLGEPITVDGHYLVRSDEARGKLPCPYGDGLFHKNMVSAERIGGGPRLAYSDLSIHLLRVHHFCQGKGSAFRLEAAELKRFLMNDTSGDDVS